LTSDKLEKYLVTETQEEALEWSCALLKASIMFIPGGKILTVNPNQGPHSSIQAAVSE